MYVYVAGDTGAPRPGIVVLQEIFGVNVAMRAVADRFAVDGYIAVAPDLYHRIAPRTEILYDPSLRPQAIALWEKLDDDGAVADAVRALAYLRDLPSCTGKAAYVGFCLGGQIALLAAAESDVDAAVAFYPVKMKTCSARLRGLRLPVQVHVGDDDHHIPPDTLAAIRDGLAGNGAAEVHVYPGAQHAFYNEFRPQGYSPDATAAANVAMHSFLARTLR